MKTRASWAATASPTPWPRRRNTAGRASSSTLARQPRSAPSTTWGRSRADVSVPGLKLTSEALVSGTAKLPRFELVKPDHVISRTTVTNLQAGVIYGYIGQVNYLVQRFRKELGAPDALVVATGGMARLVADEVGTIDKLDGILTLKGLRLIYERNR